jgi:hypothetical protein
MDMINHTNNGEKFNPCFRRNRSLIDNSALLMIFPLKKRYGHSLGSAKQHAESVPHTSLGLRLWRNPREAPTRNSTLKACHIADTKDVFHCKAIENSQLSMGD